MKLLFTGDDKRSRFEEGNQEGNQKNAHFFCELQSLSLGSCSGKMSLELESQHLLIMVYPLPVSKRIPCAYPELKVQKQQRKSSWRTGVIEEFYSLAGFLPWTLLVAADPALLSRFSILSIFPNFCISNWYRFSPCPADEYQESLSEILFAGVEDCPNFIWSIAKEIASWELLCRDLPQGGVQMLGNRWICSACESLF